jgi:alpha-ketoglutarate-dependent taurine dioxygenase
MIESAAQTEFASQAAGADRPAAGIFLDDEVAAAPLFDGGLLPLVVRPRRADLPLVDWAGSHRGVVEDLLSRHGGILFRGFAVDKPADLEAFIHAVSGEALEYKERSSPRSAVAGRIYTSTDYPPSYAIFLHNENSYQQAWPQKIFFMCQHAAATGGETPIADCRRVLAAIDPQIRDRFAAQGWMYVRNFGDGLGLDWRTVFQTDDKASVERHCRHSGITVEWKSGDRLRTCAVRPAITAHPRTGEPLWFNHATFFHVSTLEPEIREALLAEFDDESELPANTYYGDGSPIEPATLDHLRSAYLQATVRFPWQQGDLLLLDNMLVAHGRSPFRGERRILVGMSEPLSREGLPPAAPAAAATLPAF